ncbi:MAG: DUF72 domain-containing protein [Calditrichia bacterium]
MNWRIGTSGYSYEDWREVYYPPDLPKGKMLDFYAREFNTVEINSTYYGIPHPAVFYQMEKKTPPDFEFIVKLNQETTHHRRENKKAVEKLQEAIQPLADSGKLAGFLGQFPYSFKNTQENREYLLQTREYCRNVPLFIEFRNHTWDTPPVYEFLQQNGFFNVNVDEPQLKGLVKPREVAGELGYFRFHGRNAKDWWQGKGNDRYNYLYTAQEMDEWLIRISRVLQKSYKTYIFFNNHPQGKAVQNAKMLKEMLDKQLDILKS